MRGDQKSRLMLQSHQLRDDSQWSKRTRIQSGRITKPENKLKKKKKITHFQSDQEVFIVITPEMHTTLPLLVCDTVLQSCSYSTALQTSVKPCWQNIREDFLMIPSLPDLKMISQQEWLKYRHLAHMRQIQSDCQKVESCKEQIVLDTETDAF